MTRRFEKCEKIKIKMKIKIISFLNILIYIFSINENKNKNKIFKTHISQNSSTYQCGMMKFVFIEINICIGFS